MKKIKGELAPSFLRIRIFPNDLDYNFHVNNGRYLSMMDLGRFHLMLQGNAAWKLLKLGWAPVVNAIKIHYLHPIRLFNKIHLKTEIVYWDDKWVYLQQTFLEGDKVKAIALVKAGFVEKGKLIPMQKLVDLFGPGLTPPYSKDKVAAINELIS